MVPSFLHHRKTFYPTLLILIILVAFSGCLGAMNRSKTSRSASAGDMTALDRAFKPDNCTKCHLAWAKRFDYYRGWDRYGYLFDEPMVGFYDPWLRPQLKNLQRHYYATEWWQSPELYAWPGDIAKRAPSLSILSRPGGLPKIPARQDECPGPVIVVAPSGGDYTSIEKAIAKAEPGGTVFVRAGVYNEVITLRDGVNLIGEDRETTIINPMNKGHAIRATNNSIIAGFTLTGTGIEYATNRFNCAVYVSGCDSTCIIANNIFRENGLFGVWIDGAPDMSGNEKIESLFGNRQIELFDRPYTDYPNPVVVGNTFYRIGQRGVFCVHGRGEVFNNIFLGNVKAMGMERHSRPFVHHNIFYYNNVPMAVNRSEPLVCNNIMYKNQWGQRMLRGACPVMFDNVTWESPHFRDFDESGRPIRYNPYPGTGEREIDPGFADPLSCDFSFSAGSPLRDETLGFAAAGIMRDANLPQPARVHCKDSYGREVLALTDDIQELIAAVDAENEKIQSLTASYRLIYTNYLAITGDERGDPMSFTLTSSAKPAVMSEYTVKNWAMHGSMRIKTYTEQVNIDGAMDRDSGEIVYGGAALKAETGRFSEHFSSTPDKLYIGERPFRETPGGLYRDYDQYVKGAIGPLGTFYHGYLRILGGKIEEKTERVDGHDCMIVRYPHIGKDQYFLFWLDPEIGYRPRKMEQYYNEALYRRIDSYTYKAFEDGINLPMRLTITDFAVKGPVRGKKTGELSLVVDETSVRVNRIKAR